MEFLILAVLALSFGLLEAEAKPKCHGPSIPTIREIFGLTLPELKLRCDDKEKTLWNEVLDALKLNVDLGEDLVTDIASRAAKSLNGTAQVYEDLIEERCETNTAIVNVKTFTTLKIEQCLNVHEIPEESRIAEILIKSISRTCAEVKMLAMERNINKSLK